MKTNDLEIIAKLAEEIRELVYNQNPNLSLEDTINKIARNFSRIAIRSEVVERLLNESYRGIRITRSYSYE